MEPNDRPSRTRDVERFLKKQGIEDVKLVKGPGWFCFEGGETEKWQNHTVEICFLSVLTLQEWYEAFLGLREQDGER